MSWQWPGQSAAPPGMPNWSNTTMPAAAAAPGPTYTPEQWAAMNAMQQQNWQQWMTWQQQYQQWQQQYGEQYAKQMALAGQPAQPPFSSVVQAVQPPLPVDTKIAPPLPQESKPPLPPPEEPPKPPPDFNASVPPPPSNQSYHGGHHQQNMHGPPPHMQGPPPPHIQGPPPLNMPGPPHLGPPSQSNQNMFSPRGNAPQGNRGFQNMHGPRGPSTNQGPRGPAPPNVQQSPRGGPTNQPQRFNRDGSNEKNFNQFNRNAPPSLMDVNVNNSFGTNQSNSSFLPDNKFDFGNKRPGDFQEYDNSKKNRWESDGPQNDDNYQQSRNQGNKNWNLSDNKTNDFQNPNKPWQKTGDNTNPSENQQNRWNQGGKNQSKPWNSASDDLNTNKPWNQSEDKKDMIKSWNQSEDKKDLSKPWNQTEDKTDLNKPWNQSPQNISRNQPKSDQNNQSTSRNQSWPSNTNKSATARPNVEELSEAEKLFDKQFEQWEAQFNKWKDQNQNHPDKQQYKEYEAKWESWRSQLLDRREQMRKKRLGLTGPSTNTTPIKPPQFTSSTLAPATNLLSSNQTSTSPNLEQNVQKDEIENKELPSSNKSPEKNNSSDSKPLSESKEDPNASFLFSQPPKEQRTNVRSRRTSLKQDESSSQVSKENISSDTSYLKSASGSGGIPGLDLVKDNDKETENKVQNEEEKKKEISKLPDFEAISKGINSILGDEKLLNMLSLVTQNKPPTAVISDVQAQTNKPNNPIDQEELNSSIHSSDSFNNQYSDNNFNDSQYFNQSRKSSEFERNFPSNKDLAENRNFPSNQQSNRSEQESTDFRSQPNFNNDFNRSDINQQNKNNFNLALNNFNQPPPNKDGLNKFNLGSNDFQNPLLNRNNDFNIPPPNFNQRTQNDFGRGNQNEFTRGSQNEFNRGPPNDFTRGPQLEFNRRPQNDTNREPQIEFNRRPQIEFNRGPQNTFNRGPQNEFNRALQNDFNRVTQNEFNRGPHNEFNRGSQTSFNRGQQKDFNRGNQNEFNRENQGGFNRGPNWGPNNNLNNFNQGPSQGMSPRGFMDRSSDFNDSTGSIDNSGRFTDNFRNSNEGPSRDITADLRSPMNRPPRDSIDARSRGFIDGPPRNLMDGPQRGLMDGPARSLMDGPPRGPMDGTQRGPMDGSQRGPVDGPSRVSMDGPQRGPLDGPLRGPMDRPPRGPMDGPPRGPVDVPSRGLIDGPLKNLLDDMQRNSMDGVPRGHLDRPPRGSIDVSRRNLLEESRNLSDAPRGLMDDIRGFGDNKRSFMSGMRGPVDALRGFMDGPRGLMDGPRDAMDGARGSLDCSRQSMEGSRGLINESKGFMNEGRDSMNNQRGFLNRPRNLLDRPGGLGGPRGSLEISRNQNDEQLRGLMSGPIGSIEGNRSDFNRRFDNNLLDSQNNRRPWNERNRDSNYQDFTSGVSRNESEPEAPVIKASGDFGDYGRNSSIAQSNRFDTSESNQYDNQQFGGNLKEGDNQNKNETKTNSFPPRTATEKYWDEALILKPFTVIDYGHKSLNKPEATFIEPVHTFDYNHKSKNVEKEDKIIEKSFSRDSSRDSSFNRYKPYSDSPSSYKDSSTPYSSYDKYKSNDRNRSYEQRRSYNDDYNKPTYNKETCKFESRNNELYNRNSDKYDSKSSRITSENKNKPSNLQNTEIEYEDIEDEDPFADEDCDMNMESPKKDVNLDQFVNKSISSEEKIPSVTMVEDLLVPPGRNSRPRRIVIILRGPPGSGKTFLAKMIKDKEVEQGGSAPRILALDDYFMVEADKEIIEKETGRKTLVKEMVYEFEECMELSYRQSLEKAFKKTITDGYFPFIILDCINDKVKHFSDMWSFAKQNGFQVYVCQMELDIAACTKRNTHHRSEIEIERLIAGWEPTPSHYLMLDSTSLIQAGCISEVEMEEITEKSADEQDDDEDFEGHIISKWEKMDHSGDKLAKLDGTSKPLRPKTMEDYLQMDDAIPDDKPGVKRVRWADLEERRHQEKIRALGFVVGQTDWNRMLDPTQGSSALTQTKYIERVRRF